MDCSQLIFIDSAGFGTLLALLREMYRRQGRFKLACLAKPVRTLFELIQLDKIFEIYPSVTEALNALERGSRENP